MTESEAGGTADDAHASATNDPDRDGDTADRASMEELARRAEHRAAKARRHAAGAREQARRDALLNDHLAQTIHVREAAAHDRAADVTEQTAALDRSRVRRLSGARAATPQPPADISP
jgi:hypothetical protein